MPRPTTPALIDVIKSWIDGYDEELHTAFPGRIESYDPTKQTADIQPLIRHAVEQSDGSTLYEELPVLPAVPVMFPRTAGWMIALPMDVGDTVLVVCSESAIGHWRAGDGGIEYPGDLRRHHLSHAVAIPGLFVASSALSNAPKRLTASDTTDDDAAVVIGKDVATGSGPRVEIRRGGDITVIAGDGSKVSLGDVPSVAKSIIGDGEAMRQWMSKVEAMINDLKSQFNTLRTDHNNLAGTASCSVGGGPITFSVGWPTTASEISEDDITDPPPLSEKVKAI